MSAKNINPRLVASKRLLHVPEVYVEGILARDRVWLGQAITLIESTHPGHQALAQEVLRACLPHTGRSYRIGITGVPGVGKSTLIDTLGQHSIDQGHRVCVLAVDPSSERSKGSILGDKTRMPRLATQPDAYIRPSPTQGALGGIARRTRETMLLCEAAGYDVVLVETVGVGQSEISAHSLVDCFLLLTLAGAGDTLQGIKRGIMEMANVIAITKADGDNKQPAKRARGNLRLAVSLFPPAESQWRPQVLTCSAFQHESVEQLWDTLQAYKAHTTDNGYQRHRRAEQQKAWLRETVLTLLHQRVLGTASASKRWETLERQVQEQRLTALQAAEQILGESLGENRA